MNNPVLNSYNAYKKKYGADVIINGITHRAIIKDSTKDNFTKTIQMSQGIIKFGDYITYYDKATNRVDTYIVRCKLLPKLYYDESEIRLCNNFLKYKATVDGVEGVIVSIPATAFNSSLNIAYGTYFNTLDNTITVEVGCSMLVYIKPIEAQFRFILNNQAWEVEGVEDATNVDDGQGTIFIKLKSGLFDPKDDKINGIAFQQEISKPVIKLPHNAHVYTIVPNVTTATIKKYEKHQITTVCTKDGVIVESPIIKYTILDETICIVDKTGLITSLGVIGATTITVIYEDVQSTISINVIAISLLTYSISGSDVLDSTTVQKYKIVDNLGADILLPLFEFRLEKFDYHIPSKLVSSEGSGENFINLLGKKVIGELVLKAIDKNDPSLIVRKQIKTMV